MQTLEERVDRYFVLGQTIKQAETEQQVLKPLILAEYDLRGVTAQLVRGAELRKESRASYPSTPLEWARQREATKEVLDIAMLNRIHEQQKIEIPGRVETVYLKFYGMKL